MAGGDALPWPAAGRESSWPGRQRRAAHCTVPPSSSPGSRGRGSSTAKGVWCPLRGEEEGAALPDQLPSPEPPPPPPAAAASYLPGVSVLRLRFRLGKVRRSSRRYDGEGTTGSSPPGLGGSMLVRWAALRRGGRAVGAQGSRRGSWTGRAGGGGGRRAVGMRGESARAQEAKAALPYLPGRPQGCSALARGQRPPCGNRAAGSSRESPGFRAQPPASAAARRKKQGSGGRFSRAGLAFLVTA
ncbi:chloride intracellular channel protein 6-like [Hemicordylus capensis]|uniref:chloride intracellular channel protein 6-like n=1 Tax=Hemicordylus capensis TaxID=884348 RepID=UPI0023023106|nr:chloride intracellular channel protein 6-like [Hemicordylus capensis]